MVRNLMVLFAFLLFLGAILFPVSALASSKTGTEMSGEGVGQISGWNVANIQYELSTDPSFLAGVSFDLDAPADRVAVKLSSSDTQFSDCTSYGAYHWDCRVQGIAVSSLDEFRVIAVGD